jgi:hypothetical protein
MEDQFYCVRVTISRLGGGDSPVDYFYKSRKNADAHIGGYRQLTSNADYKVVTDTGDTLLLRTPNWTEIKAELTDFYFED